MGQATVLIVEDEPEVAELLAFNLQAAGYATQIAHDGLTACRVLGSQAPDLVLLDVLLPDLQGWDICRMIRQHGGRDVADLPILMLTALGTSQDKLRGLALGADDYLTKPFSMQEVVLKVGKWLARRHTEKQRTRHIENLERERQAERDLQGLLFHELKNKLVVIGGFARHLAVTDQADSRERRYAEVVRHTTQYLSDLAEQMLLLRKVELGEVRLACETIDLSGVLGAVAALHRDSAAEKGVGVEVEQGAGPPRIRADSLAVKVCLSNLVENAIRYSPAGSTIAVRVGAAAEQGFLEVVDQGPGIPEAERERVFERFHRTPGSLEPGAGLGLYLVRTLARAMNGEVALLDGPGGGTRARLYLPLQPAPVARPPVRP